MTMSRRKLKSRSRNRYAVCVNNLGYPASLELHKIYMVLPDRDAERHRLMRVIDESGEDYLFSAKNFVFVELPMAVKKSIKGAA